MLRLLRVLDCDMDLVVRAPKAAEFAACHFYRAREEEAAKGPKLEAALRKNPSPRI
jgi:hypothetical protein